MDRNSAVIFLSTTKTTIKYKRHNSTVMLSKHSVRRTNRISADAYNFTSAVSFQSKLSKYWNMKQGDKRMESYKWQQQQQNKFLLWTGRRQDDKNECEQREWLKKKLVCALRDDIIFSRAFRRIIYFSSLFPFADAEREVLPMQLKRAQLIGIATISTFLVSERDVRKVKQ